MFSSPRVPPQVSTLSLHVPLFHMGVAKGERVHPVTVFYFGSSLRPLVTCGGGWVVRVFANAAISFTETTKYLRRQRGESCHRHSDR
jgi:hypothetical protein